MPQTASWSELQWFNEPTWRVQDDVLQVRTARETDFWRATYYGFVRDSGHVLHTAPLGEFTAQVCVEGNYQALYDQAGLMLRSSPECWVKTGVEFVNEQQLSAVVTRDYSDWNVRPIGMPERVDLKVTRVGDAVRVHARVPGGDWTLLRLAYYPPDLPAVVGVYACSPQREGFEVRFSDFTVGPPEQQRPY
ncbi:DUF1349 domain-containing protein [Deinococcus sonorensis]|uniref:DUF1349 domain-containing protein n=2 Tax=Deinococcus sonorensis TaxID=309891 RepID=A0AAU7U524_9DEIO